jgi:hemerythrin-like domain-containing protein
MRLAHRVQTPGDELGLTRVKLRARRAGMLRVMRHTALDVINDEHQALSAMLRSLSLLVAQSRREGRAPAFEVLRAMLLYVDEFPERLHHPKESQLLFPKLAQRCPALAPVIARLERDHQAGERAIRELEHALLAFEVLGESRREPFEKRLETYQRFYLDHMAVEEDEILPAARRTFDADDWAEIDAAFGANRDPLTGHDPDPVYAPLFHRIVMTAPAPIGLGPSTPD